MPGFRVRNALQTLALLTGMAMVLGALGWLLAEWAGVVWALFMGAMTFLLVPRLPGAALARWMGAAPVREVEAPDLYHLLDELALRAGLEQPPDLYLLPGPALLAMSFGTRANPALALSEGILRVLDGRELTGVLAHEIAHLRHDDLRVMLLATVVGRITALLAMLGQLMLLFSLPALMLGAEGIPWGVLAILAFAPPLSDLMQLGLARTREYDADAAAARLTGDPGGLVRALERLERTQRGGWEVWFRPLRPWEPPSWLRTHPSTEERVRRLLDMAGEG